MNWQKKKRRYQKKVQKNRERSRRMERAVQEDFHEQGKKMKVETFEEILKRINRITKKDLQDLAKELFGKDKYNLQVIGPFKDKSKFENILE